MTAEEWRPIPGYPDYEVSSLGRVASVKRGRLDVLAGGKTDTGYRNVLLYSAGARSGHRVHALVALAFHGPRPPGLEVRHLDGDQLNNAAANLRYGTHAENMADRRRHNGLLLIVGRDTYRPRQTLRRLGETCRRGHPRTESNTYAYPNGRVMCRLCKSHHESESRRKRRARASREHATAAP